MNVCVCLLGALFVFVRFQNGSDVESAVVGVVLFVCLCGCVLGTLHVSNMCICHFPSVLFFVFLFVSFLWFFSC